MKKLFLVMAAFCLLFVSCNTKQVEAPVEEVATTHEGCQHNHEGKGCCGLTEEQKTMFAQWKQFETLEAQAQADLIAAMKAFVDEKMAKCDGEKHEGCQNKCEGEKDCAQKHAEMKEKWENFEKLAIEEQKALLDNILEHQKKHAPKHEGCQGEKHEGCQGHNHEGCQGHNHEGCQGHNHEGCGNH